MGSKTELPHMSMPLKDSMEDLESSFSALVHTSGQPDVTNCEGESSNFMSQLSLKLDSLHKDEIFDLAQESPVQALDSLPPPNRDITEHSVPQALDPIISDDEDTIDGVLLLEDVSIGHETSTFSDVHLLEDSVDIIDKQEVDNKVAELVVQPPAFATLLENTTPMGSLFSNDTSIPPEEHNPKKGTCAIMYVYACTACIYTYCVNCMCDLCERKRMHTHTVPHTLHTHTHMHTLRILTHAHIILAHVHATRMCTTRVRMHACNHMCTHTHTHTT